MIVDDHSIVRFGIRSLLSHNKQMDVCAEAEDRASAFREFAQHKPDIILMDISIDGNGLELTKQFIQLAPHVKIIIISMHDECLYADRALRAGAKGYLMKRDASLLLLNALDSVIKGDIYLSESMTKLILKKMASTGNSVSLNEEKLSDRELEVFNLIGEGYPTKQISQKLKLSPKTIETYQEHIKEKLHIKDSTELKKQAIAWRNSHLS